MTSLLLAAGDASGDQHASEFVRCFRDRQPDARFAGLGGRQMARAGVELCVDQADLAVGGLLELAGSGFRIASAWRRLGAALDELRPDLVVLVDSGGFNLPFSRRVRRRCRTPILYYVAPQVWAWRRGRIRKLAGRVDRLAVIFPFEVEVYRGSGLEVEFVGHPLVDVLRDFRARVSRQAALEQLGLDASRRWLALLPGSRRNEVRQHLSLQLETARCLHQREAGLGFVVAVAPCISGEGVHAAVRRARLPASLPIRVLEGQTRSVIRASQAVLLKPGTATLEAVLLECPMVVMGRAHPLTAAVVRRVVRLPSLAMPNLIAGKPVVPEFLQERARPEDMAEALRGLLQGEARERQLAALSEVELGLGEGGSARRAAEIAEAMIAPAGP